MPTKLVVDCSTGITSEVELTAEEIAQAQADAAAFSEAKAKEEADAQAKAQAKAELLDRLGITEAEAQLLLS